MSTRTLAIAAADGWVDIAADAGPVALVEDANYQMTFEGLSKLVVRLEYGTDPPAFEEVDGHPVVPGPEAYYFCVPPADESKVWIRNITDRQAILSISPTDPGGDGSVAP